jgi:hypothetical protein
MTRVVLAGSFWKAAQMEEIEEGKTSFPVRRSSANKTSMLGGRSVIEGRHGRSKCESYLRIV